MFTKNDTHGTEDDPSLPPTPLDLSYDFSASSSSAFYHGNSVQQFKYGIPRDTFIQSKGFQSHGTESAVRTHSVSDHLMLVSLLYLEHGNCKQRDTCKTCELISRHFKQTTNQYGVSGKTKNLNPEGTFQSELQQKTRRICLPKHPSLDVVFKQQRSNSASDIYNGNDTESNVSSAADDSMIKQTVQY